MAIKVFDSELKVMEILWNGGDLTAVQIIQAMKEQAGWSRTTTYTVIGKLIDKGAIERRGENFLCRASITREQVQQHEATELLDKLFNGSAELFMSALYNGKKMSEAEAERMKRLIEKFM